MKCGASDRNKYGACKPCNRAAALAWYYRNQERATSRSRAYVQANKDKHDAWRNEYVASGRAREANAEWYRKNADRVAKTAAAWRAKNPEAVAAARARRKSGKRSIPKADIKAVVQKLLALQRGKCACCGASLANGYHIDHVVPLALGGSNTVDNLQLLTPACNMKKSSKHPVDFMRSRGFLL